MDIIVLSNLTGTCVGVLTMTQQECAIYDPVTGKKKYILAGTTYDKDFVLPKLTGGERMAYTPKEGALIYDTTDQLIYVGDGKTLGGVLCNAQLYAKVTSIEQAVNNHKTQINVLNINVTEVQNQIRDAISGAEDAVQAAQDANTAAQNASAAAAAAQEAAEGAQNSIGEAITKAEAASTAAEEATAAGEAATIAAQEATATAQEAVDNIDSAMQTAQEANDAAQSATSAASTAQTTANEAKALAEEAKALAENQKVLQAGDNIAIENDIISASDGVTVYEQVVATTTIIRKGNNRIHVATINPQSAIKGLNITFSSFLSGDIIFLTLECHPMNYGYTVVYKDKTYTPKYESSGAGAGPNQKTMRLMLVVPYDNGAPDVIAEWEGDKLLVSGGAVDISGKVDKVSGEADIIVLSDGSGGIKLSNAQIGGEILAAMPNSNIIATEIAVQNAIAPLTAINGIIVPLDKVKYMDDIGYYAELINVGDHVSAVYNAFNITAVSLLVKSANPTITGNVQLKINGEIYTIFVGGTYDWQNIKLNSPISGVLKIELVMGLTDGAAAVSVLIGNVMLADDFYYSTNNAIMKRVAAKPLLYSDTLGYYHLLDDNYLIEPCYRAENLTAVILKVRSANPEISGNAAIKITVGETVKSAVIPIGTGDTAAVVTLDAPASGVIKIERDTASPDDTLKDGDATVSVIVRDIQYNYVEE